MMRHSRRRDYLPSQNGIGGSYCRGQRDPGIMATLQPLTSTHEFDKASYAIICLILGGVENKLRKELLNLPPISRLSRPMEIAGRPVLTLYGFSTQVRPRPQDWPDLSLGGWRRKMLLGAPLPSSRNVSAAHNLVPCFAPDDCLQRVVSIRGK